jgi:bile acid:Na+ symporter, BASS family
MSAVNNSWVVPAAMFLLMFSMGLTLGVEDFRRVVAMPRAVVVGSFAQLVGMPLAGFAVAHAFGLDPLLSAGLMIVAACPGGVMSNVLVHLGRADTALSVTLTATATAVTLFTLPLWVRAMLSSLGGAGADIEMPLLETAVQLGGFTVLPVLVGMASRSTWPGLARYERLLARVSAAVIILVLAIATVRSDDPPVAEFGASLLPAALLLGCALVLGVLLPHLLGLDWRDSTTIGVELCIKNGVLGLFVATQSLGSLVAGVPVLAFMTFQMPVGIAVLAAYNLWRRAEERRMAAVLGPS